MKPDLDLVLLILAAGRGTRMRNGLPKVLHKLAGQSLISHVVSLGSLSGAGQIVVVLSPDMDDVRSEVVGCRNDAAIAIQPEALGTGNAVRAALPNLPNTGTIVVLFGDTPLITASTIAELKEAREATDAAIVVMAMAPENPHGYGRLKLDDDGNLVAIVEHVQADERLRLEGLCNSGVMAIDAARCHELVEAIEPQVDNGEYYLTDIVGHAVARGWRCTAMKVAAEEGHGINSQAQLAHANAILQTRLRRQLLEEGVIMPAPDTVQLSFDTRVAPGAEIEPFTVFGPGVSVAAEAKIRSFSHLEGAHVGPKAIVGPYARIRPGSTIGEKARIGNFVETKNAEIGFGAKANHLTYLGDCRIGAESNIGAGTITCNYDGFNKSRTEIGVDVFIGSNSALVAPVNIGDGAIVGAGSTITSDIPRDAVGLSRSKQTTKSDAANALRKRLAQKNETG